MTVLPEDPRCPNCEAQTWSRTEPRARECQTCGYVQRLHHCEHSWEPLGPDWPHKGPWPESAMMYRCRHCGRTCRLVQIRDAEPAQ